MTEDDMEPDAEDVPAGNDDVQDPACACMHTHARTHTHADTHTHTHTHTCTH